MISIIPTLFIQHGRVVSWYKGSDNPEKKVYKMAPHNWAKHFEKQGAQVLFVVDLDGNQEERLPEIKLAFSGELWWAGQVRDLQKIQELFDKGAQRIVLGQSAQDLYAQALNKYGASHIIAGIKTKHYDEVPDLCQTLKEHGFQDIIIKDLNAEGTLLHPNYDVMEKAVYFSGLNVYASGGVSSKRDVDFLEKTGVKGVLIARALYEGQLDLSVLS